MLVHQRVVYDFVSPKSQLGGTDSLQRPGGPSGCPPRPTARLLHELAAARLVNSPMAIDTPATFTGEQRVNQQLSVVVK